MTVKRDGLYTTRSFEFKEKTAVAVFSFPLKMTERGEALIPLKMTEGSDNTPTIVIPSEAACSHTCHPEPRPRARVEGS